MDNKEFRKLIIEKLSLFRDKLASLNSKVDGVVDRSNSAFSEDRVRLISLEDRFAKVSKLFMNAKVMERRPNLRLNKQLRAKAIQLIICDCFRKGMDVAEAHTEIVLQKRICSKTFFYSNVPGAKKLLEEKIGGDGDEKKDI